MEVASMNDNEEQVVYRTYVLGDLIIENVPYEKVVTYVLNPETSNSINKLSEENHNDGRLNNKVVEYKGHNEK